MKHGLVVWILSLALLLASCGESQSIQQNESPRQSDDIPESSESTEFSFEGFSTEKSDIEKQIEFLVANFENWKAEDEFGWWGYAITDLDQNGRLEVVTSEDHGTGHYKTTSIREVNADFDGLTLCGQDYSCDLDVLKRLAANGGPQSCGPLITPQWYYDDEPQTYSVYYDSNSDLYHYISSDSVLHKDDWWGTFTVQRSFALQNGEVTGVLLSYQKHNGDNWQDCWDISGNYVTHKVCQKAANDYYSNMTLLEAKILWIGDRHLREVDKSELYELLKSSMDSFSIDTKKQ